MTPGLVAEFELFSSSLSLCFFLTTALLLLSNQEVFPIHLVLHLPVLQKVTHFRLLSTFKDTNNEENSVILHLVDSSFFFTGLCVHSAAKRCVAYYLFCRYCSNKDPCPVVIFLIFLLLGCHSASSPLSHRCGSRLNLIPAYPSTPLARQKLFPGTSLAPSLPSGRRCLRPEALVCQDLEVMLSRAHSKEAKQKHLKELENLLDL